MIALVSLCQSVVVSFHESYEESCRQQVLRVTTEVVKVLMWSPAPDPFESERESSAHTIAYCMLCRRKNVNR